MFFIYTHIAEKSWQKSYYCIFCIHRHRSDDRKKAMNGKSKYVFCRREGVSPAASIPGKDSWKCLRELIRWKEEIPFNRVRLRTLRDISAGCYFLWPEAEWNRGFNRLLAEDGRRRVFSFYVRSKREYVKTRRLVSSVNPIGKKEAKWA